MALAVLQGLGYEPRKIPSIASDWSRIGLGISDGVSLSSVLSTKFFYSNSFFDTFPFLDIRDVPEQAKGKFEFVVCSDVLEHIDQNLSAAMVGLRSLLTSKGFLVASVPVGRSHRDFYPQLESFVIIDNSVHWTDKFGVVRIDTDPEFHGGRGQNLAFRQFSEDSFGQALADAGFTRNNPVNFSDEFGVPRIDSPGVFIAY